MIKPSFLAAVALLASSGLRAETLYALTTDNRLITLDSASPALGTAIGLTGLADTERLLGLDARPSNGLLYTLSNLGNIYTLDAGSGAATFLTALKSPIGSNLLGFDFNPNADLGSNASLRVITASGGNFAVNVNPGANLGAVTAQTAISSASNPGEALRLTGVAYTNNDTDPTTPTVLYGIDTAGNALYATSAPAGGAYTRVGALGASSLNVFGFDVSGRTGVAYAGLTSEDSYSSLYAINLQTGAATLLGSFGIQGNTALPTIVGLTAATPAVPEPGSLALGLSGLGLLAARMHRRRG